MQTNYSMGTIQLPTATNVITTGNLNNQPQLNLPSAPKDVTPYQSIIDGALTSLPKLDTTISTAETNQNNLVNLLTSKITDLQGKAQYTKDAQDTAGVGTEQAQLDKYNAQLNDINASLTGLVNESKAIPLQMQNEVAGQGVTDAGLAPLTTAKLRENAIKALTLSSTADAISSNISNSEARLQRAKEKAQQIVDLKYKPIEDSIAQIQTFLDINQKYILDPAEKKQAKATEIALQERSRIIAEQKANDNKIQDMFINASASGAPAKLVANAKAIADKTKDPSQVAIALGQYSGDYYKTELLKTQIQTQKLEQAKTRAEISKLNAQTVAEKAKAKTDNTMALTKAKDQATAITSLLGNGYLTTAVGPNSLARTSFLSWATGGKQDFLSGMSSILNDQTLNALQTAKQGGATFGALSEGELKLLQDSATALNASAIRDEKGNLTGFNMSESKFKDELTKLQTYAQLNFQRLGGSVDTFNPIDKNASSYLDNTILPAINSMGTAGSTASISSYASLFNRK